MWVKELKLINFRNYEKTSVTFEKGINIILGDNGSGKTSLVEAIGYLPLCKSIRSGEDKELVGLNKEFARIEASIQKQRETRLKIVITPKGKRIEIDEAEVKKVSEIAGVCKVVSFLPKDVELFKEIPLKRRKFIDLNLSMIDGTYLKILTEYNHLLNNLRMALKQNELDKVLVKTLMESLGKRGKMIQEKRIKFIAMLNEILIGFAKYLGDENTTMKVIYHPDVEMHDDYENKCISKFEENIKFSSGSRVLIPGIHADDISFVFNEKDLAAYGSQGQNRLAVIALKLSLFKLMSERYKEDPIVILDDVLSELDDYHQEKLIKLLNRMEQVFVTGTKIELKEKFNLYTVKDNDVRRNN